MLRHAPALLLTFACSSPSGTASPDAGPPPQSDAGALWSWCPNSDSYDGDDGWSDSVQVSDQVFCYSPPEDESLKSMKSKQIRARFVPGRYNIPPRDISQGEITFPACTERLGAQGPVQDGSGAFEIAISALVGTQLSMSFPFTDNKDLEVNISTVEEAETWPSLSIDDSSFGGGFSSTAVGVSFAQAYMAPCQLSQAQEFIIDAEFSNGDSIQFKFRGYPGSVTTGPSGEHHVTGTVDGQRVDINDYYKIFYSPSHHHFSSGGEHAVLFDQPLRNACGLKLETGSDNVTSASLIDCDLNDLDSLVVTSSSRN